MNCPHCKLGQYCANSSPNLDEHITWRCESIAVLWRYAPYFEQVGFHLPDQYLSKNIAKYNHLIPTYCFLFVIRLCSDRQNTSLYHKTWSPKTRVSINIAMWTTRLITNENSSAEIPTADLNTVKLAGPPLTCPLIEMSVTWYWRTFLSIIGSMKLIQSWLWKNRKQNVCYSSMTYNL